MLEIKVNVGSVAEADLLDKFMCVVYPEVPYKVQQGGVVHKDEPDWFLQWNDHVRVTVEQLKQICAGHEGADIQVLLDVAAIGETLQS